MDSLIHEFLFTINTYFQEGNRWSVYKCRLIEVENGLQMTPSLIWLIVKSYDLANVAAILDQ